MKVSVLASLAESVVTEEVAANAGVPTRLTIAEAVARTEIMAARVMSEVTFMG
jgi:hypothetical protein